MLNKIKIFYWLLIRGYYLHLYFLNIFFFKKKLFKKYNFKEYYSYKNSKKICERLFVEKKKIYNYFSKLKKIPNFRKKKIFLGNIIILKKDKLGGGSDVEFIYNLILILKPKKIIEFGVANGWSTLSILEGLKKNRSGELTSIDMPYYLQNKTSLIGNLLKGKNFKNWKLFIEPQVNFLFRMKDKKYDFCHYDSDKSYQGRMLAYDKVWKNLKKKGILLSDDISDNMAFFDFCSLKEKKPFIIKYKKKFLGLVVK